MHASRTTDLLAANGVKPGHHVAVLLPSCAEHVILIHALAQLGAVLVPLNFHLTISELRHQVQLSGCTHLVLGSETEELAQHFASELICTDVAELVDLRTSPLALTRNSSPQDLLIPSGKSDSIHSIIFTSGTTGRPRGVQLTYANHFHSATSSAYRLGILPSDRWMLCMPLWHIGGLAIVLRSCLYGIALVLIEKGFQAPIVRRVLDKERVTLVSLVPTMLHRMLALGEQAPPHTLRCVLLGGTAAPRDLLSQATASGWPIAVTYGLTEAASQVSTASPELTRRKPGSAGKPLFGVSVDVCAPTGASLPPDEIGEIVVSGSILMRGYCGQPNATGQVIRKGRLHTGDMGYLDPEGDLWIVQRRVDQIISGGENVSPAEIETALCQHPAVKQACVVGLDDPEWGQCVAALVVAENISCEILRRFCRQRLADYKQPRVMQLVDELPRTQSGKINRVAAREMLTGAR